MENAVYKFRIVADHLEGLDLYDRAAEDGGTVLTEDFLRSRRDPIIKM